MSNPKFDLVISNAQIADSNAAYAGQTLDIGIQNGMIAALGKHLEGVETIDAQLAWVSPGWLDLYATCPDPGEEWTEDLLHLAKAAAHGGFTDVCVCTNSSFGQQHSGIGGERPRCFV
jgi:dihydroorotase